MEVKKSEKQSVYYIGLFSVVFIWGLSPVISKYMLGFYSPTFFTAMESFICFISLVILTRKKWKYLNRDYFKVAVPTGLFYTAACILQKVGLTMTTPTRFSFLENIDCVVVPVLMFFFVGKKPTILKAFSGVLCLFGVFVLCGENFAGGVHFGLGEVLCALAGIFYGVNIAGTAAFAKKLDTTLYLLIQFAIQTIFSFGYCLLFEDIRFSLAIPHVAVLIYCALIGNVLCWTVRTISLKHLDASFVAVVMPFASVTTGVVSVVLGMDVLSGRLIFGALVILMAILLSGVGDMTVNQRVKSENSTV